ncbi:MAG: 30S ribosomal protein S17 [Actinobacteria bacterium]|nr:30S ribosomal protein S17 [Actinomycetota bacterium]
MSDEEVLNPVDAAEAESTRASRKIREGLVTSTKMNKTIVVTVVDRKRHPRYRKTIQHTTRLHVHDETGDANEGDRVRVMETRPLSKTKRWRLVEVVERAR